MATSTDSSVAMIHIQLPDVEGGGGAGGTEVYLGQGDNTSPFDSSVSTAAAAGSAIRYSSSSNSSAAQIQIKWQNEIANMPSPTQQQSRDDSASPSASPTMLSALEFAEVS